MTRLRVKLTKQTRDALKAIASCSTMEEAVMTLYILGFPVVRSDDRAWLNYEHKNFVVCLRRRSVHFATKNRSGDCVARYVEIQDILKGRSLGFDGDYSNYPGRRYD